MLIVVTSVFYLLSGWFLASVAVASPAEGAPTEGAPAVAVDGVGPVSSGFGLGVFAGLRPLCSAAAVDAAWGQSVDVRLVAPGVSMRTYRARDGYLRALVFDETDQVRGVVVDGAGAAAALAARGQDDVLTRAVGLTAEAARLLVGPTATGTATELRWNDPVSWPDVKSIRLSCETTCDQLSVNWKF
jgi:hypothetical protein